MIGDLRDRDCGAELSADLCIVGAGAAGIAIAREFLDTRTEVILLDSGGLRRSADTEALNRGHSDGMPPESLTESRARLLGGATALWAGQCLPPEPGTFEQRPWVPYSGWPFGHEQVEPYHRRAEALFRIEGETYDERVWDAFGVTRPAVDRARLGHQFSVWCPRPHLGRLYRRRLAASRNVKVLLHATAIELITTTAGDRFDSVRIATPEGKTARVRARACVVCGGGVENARLLLASTGAHPEGAGNGRDLVGRFFQEHPNLHAASIAGADVSRLQELYGLFYRRGIRYLPRLVLSPELQRTEEVLSCSAHPVFHFAEDSGIEAARRVYRSARSRRRPDELRGELRRIAGDLPRLASIAHSRVARGRSARVRPDMVTLQVYAEQAPNPESRVTLSSHRDRFGIPLPHVDWRLTEQDRRTSNAMVRGVAAEFRRLNLGEIRPEGWLADADWAGHVSDSYHHMGTTRMGTDPATSVVDENSRVHGIDGLFVAGSSVFPASGYVNPTLMIVSLAIRLGDHLKSALARPSDGAW